MKTKLDAAELYRNAINRSKVSVVSQRPKTFSRGGTLMGRMEEDKNDVDSNLSIEDRIRILYSAQRQALKESL